MNASRRLPLLSAPLLTLALQHALPAQTAATPSLAVDAASNRHAISPQIYGIVSYGLDTTFAAEIKVPNVRWGGDGTTRYNWQVDSSNAGFDWYFMGGNGQANPVPGASADSMISTYRSAGAASLITVPIIPYVNKTSAWNCSFPISVYGGQQSTNPYVHPNGDNCGNSLSPSGTQLTDKNIYANHVDNSTQLQAGWLQHLIAAHGTAANGGVPFYQLDNEPLGWGNTHRDVLPNGAPYSTIATLGTQYASMIKQQDPTALVLGPSDFTLGGWIGTPSQQNNLFAGQYYLQQMAAYGQAHGSRVLDYFDEHYYPNTADPATQLAATRTLWDPTFNGGTWVEQYFFNGPMQLIPRFHQWIAQYYPGTKLAFSEYSIDSGRKQVTDALAEADVLGIFGREGVDLANMWQPPAPTDPIAYAFRLFRDFDGQGGQFGETGIQSTSTDQSQLSIYGAQRTGDKALTLVVLNKTSNPIQTSLSLANFAAGSTATVYSYTGANLQKIVAAPSVNLAPAAGGQTSLSYSFPGYSATVFVIPGAVATQGPIAGGSYTVRNAASGLLLDDPGYSYTSGTQMIQWSSNGGANQKWVFTARSGGFYTVRNGASGLYLSDPSTASSPSSPLEQLTAQTAAVNQPVDAQLWSLTASGNGYTLHNKATGHVADDPGSASAQGTRIVLAASSGGTDQTWSIQ